MLVIKSNPITRKLNFYRLDLQTAGFGGGDGTKAKSETAIPFAKLSQLTGIKEILIDDRSILGFDIVNHVPILARKQDTYAPNLLFFTRDLKYLYQSLS